MIKTLLTFVVAAVGFIVYMDNANAYSACGFPPFPPFGTRAVCVCDRAQNCDWIFVGK